MRLAAVGLLGWSWLLGTAQAGEPRTISVTYDFARPTVEQRNGFAAVEIENCDVRVRSGDAALPFRTARILLPPGCRVEKVEAQALQEPIPLEGTWRVELGRTPAPPQKSVQRGTESSSASPSAGGVRSRSPVPRERVQLASVQSMAGCRIALVRLFPVQYVPASGQLLFTPRLSVVLSVSPTGAPTQAPVVSRIAEQAWSRVAGFVDNPALLAEYRAARPEGTNASGPRHDYLLVTPEALLPAFQPLVDRKIRDGLSVKTETIEHIATHRAGKDSAEKLRNYIRYAYTNWGVQYVLLGGDTPAVPCRYAYVHRSLTEAESLVPSDLYFACLDGSWNRDADHRWGEATDGEEGDDVDLLAEVDLGRAPVETVAEVAAFVEKTVRYEERGNRNAGQALLLATRLEQGAAQGGNMFGPLLPWLNNYAVARLDDRSLTTPPWKAVDAIDALNRSPHLVLYNGHGDTDNIMRFSTGDLNALTNQDLFLAYSVGCNAGQFDNDRFSPDSIGEELVKRPRHGAFAAVFNSRAGWYEARHEERYSGEFQTKFFQQLLKKGQTRLGTACQGAKHEMLGHIEASGIMPYRWCYYEITLFGDPHVSLKLPGAAAQAEATLRIGDAASPASLPRRAFAGGAAGPSRTAE